MHLFQKQVSLLTTNHANLDSTRALPPFFGAVVNAIVFLSLDLGVAFPSSGCLVPRFGDQMRIETSTFIAILALLVLAYLYSKWSNHRDAWIQLRRFVDVSGIGPKELEISDVIIQMLTCYSSSRHTTLR